MKTFLLSTLLALSTFAANAQAVRGSTTLDRLLRINPYATATADQLFYIVLGPTATNAWGAPRTAYWTASTALSTNTANVFASPFGGRWVFPDSASPIQDATWYGGTNIWSLDRYGNLVIGTTNVIEAIANTIQNPPPDTVVYGRQNNGAGNIVWTPIVGTGGAATNATQVKVNSSAYFPMANFLDTANIYWGTVGGVIYAYLQPHSVTEALIAAAYTAKVEARSNHTGTQLASTISDFSDASWLLFKQQLSAGTGLTLAISDPSRIATFSLGPHTHSGSDITSGTVSAARLGAGIPSVNTFLRGDGTWAVLTTNGTSLSYTGVVASVNGTSASQLAFMDSPTIAWDYSTYPFLYAAVQNGSLDTSKLTPDTTSYFLDRANHTGVQLLSTIVGYTNIPLKTAANIYGGAETFNGSATFNSTVALNGTTTAAALTSSNLTVTGSFQSPYAGNSSSFKGGLGAIANAPSATAVGSAATVNAIGGSSYGDTAISTNYSVSVGYHPSSASYGISLGYFANSANSSVSIGRSANASGPASIAMGLNSTATSDDAIALNGSAAGIDSVALNGITLADYGLSWIGNARGTHSISLDQLSKSGDYSSAIGYNALATNSYSIAYGANTVNRWQYSTALGYAAVTTKDHQVALGQTGDEVWVPTKLVVGTTNIIDALATKANLSHTHDGADIVSGTVNVARLGSGTPGVTTFLRGDGTWAVVTTNGSVAAAAGAVYVNNNYVTNINTDVNLTSTVAGQQVTLGVNTNKVAMLAGNQKFTGANEFATAATFDSDIIVAGSAILPAVQADDIVTYASVIAAPNPTNSWVAFFDTDPGAGRALMYSAPWSTIKGGDIYAASNNVFAAGNTFQSNVAITNGGALLVNGTNVMDAISGATLSFSQRKLAGRGETSGSGVAEEITLGSAFTMVGTRLDLASSDYGDIIVSDGGTVMEIDSGVVTYAKMQNTANTGRILGRGTVSSGPPQELTAELPIVVTNTTVGLKDGTMPLAKLTNSTAASRLLGRGNSAAGPFQEITLGTGLSMSGQQLNASAGTMVKFVAMNGAEIPYTSTNLLTMLGGVRSGEDVIFASGQLSNKVVKIEASGRFKSISDQWTGGTITATIGGLSQTFVFREGDSNAVTNYTPWTLTAYFSSSGAWGSLTYGAAQWSAWTPFSAMVLGTPAGGLNVGASNTVELTFQNPVPDGFGDQRITIVCDMAIVSYF